MNMVFQLCRANLTSLIGSGWFEFLAELTWPRVTQLSMMTTYDQPSFGLPHSRGSRPHEAKLVVSKEGAVTLANSSRQNY